MVITHVNDNEIRIKGIFNKQNFLNLESVLR